ncbi:DNA polymerase III subunit chi [Falsirhodobacter algicola]|uniref:DNA polymerase III subunit chi n=1 Tax=Falsirhodobacter algicola TaxID=2692330 RepID=A0A8J8MUA7_9RHOB|nr:DNA polymerase III subunit chi [Falsirhodobacter algicola]QUS36885.1 DNA polymerase III subunit chi [Falsirhodobacter algicola]
MFYHLTQSRLEDTAFTLLKRALGAGWRVMVRGDEAVLSVLDDALWTLDEESFLPHGRDGGGHDDLQPVLLGTGAIGNDANCLMVVGTAGFDPAEAAPLDRLWVLFDGLDNAALAQARDQWRGVVAAGVTAQYWSEESGRWEMKAERSGAA